jgi:hypothetical protein
MMRGFIELCDWLSRAAAGRQLLIPLRAALPNTPDAFLIKGKLGPEWKVFFVAVSANSFVRGLVRISDAESETSKMELDVIPLSRLTGKKLSLENYMRHGSNPPTFQEQLLTLMFEGDIKIDLRPSMFERDDDNFDQFVHLMLTK